MAVLGTYLGAVKPVGEKLIFNFNAGATANLWTTTQSRYYDFVIQQNYIVTGLKISKTLVKLSASDTPTDTLTVRVLSIDETGTAGAVIAQSAFTGTAGGLSTTQMAGVATAIVVIGTADGTTNLYANGTVADPELLVPANKKTISGTANSQQRIRIAVTGVPDMPTSTGINPSCLIEVQLAKYTEIAQGNYNIQLGELTTPSVVA